MFVDFVYRYKFSFSGPSDEFCFQQTVQVVIQFNKFQ